MTEWFNDEQFWSDVAPVLFTAQRMNDSATEVAQIVELLNLSTGAQVLDLGCGIGRHSREFTRRGMRVCAVDRTEFYLKQGREAAARESLDTEWVRADMREFVRPDAFDAAVNLLSSFGYFDDPSDDLRVVRNLYSSLKPGGRLVMDMMGKEVLARIFRRYDWHEEADGTILLEERTVQGAWESLDIRWIVIRGGERREHRFRLRLFSAVELRELLRCAGFQSIEVFGSLSRSPYDQDAERMVACAVRPS